LIRKHQGMRSLGKSRCAGENSSGQKAGCEGLKWLKIECNGAVLWLHWLTIGFH